jgi:NADH-quinone oxidoreductase subunit G
MADVVQDTVLNVSERGDRAVIGKFEDKDLTHPWAGNVIDLCPVGSLLSKDFLNKARSWELDRSPSVCPNCTQGCNSIIETRDNVVVRMRPRSNTEVNQYFLCDTGRLNYRWLNETSRVEAPLVRQGQRFVAQDWDAALNEVVALLEGRRVFVLASPMLSNESLFALRRLVDKTGGAGAFRVERGPESPLPGVEDLALRAERAANVRGAELLGFAKSDTPLDGLGSGDVLVIADVGGAPLPVSAEALAKAGAVVLLGTSLPEITRVASVVLPVTNMAEEEGTFTNLRGRVQRYMQAKAPPGMARPVWWAVGDLLGALGESSDAYVASDVFTALAAGVPAFSGMSYDTLGLRGQVTSDVSRSAGAAR